MRMQSWVKKWILFILLTVVAVVSFAQNSPPLPDSSQHFSTERAFSHLQQLARAPHPTGSTEHERVRGYLVTQIEKMGYQPHIQKTAYSLTGANRNLITSATLHNILVRVPGTASTMALLVSAHYDSEIGSPGANDNGVAVAALLETLQALSEGIKLKNDVIFFFSDGEELDLMGARAFWKEHPWAKDVGMVLNYESKGSSGPSLMFETGPGNGWLVREMGAALSHPVTNSMMSDAYQLMPNDTDFTIAQEQGVVGLNFAYGEGGYTYHIALDSLDHVDPRSLQHQSQNVFEAVTHFGNADLTRVQEPDRVYFNVFHVLVSYPKTITVLIALLATALVIYALVRRGIRRTLSWADIGKSSMLTAGIILGTGGLIYLLWIVVTWQWTTDMILYRLEWLILACAILILAFLVGLTTLLPAWADRTHMLAAGILISLILLWATTLSLPGASFLFFFPFLLHYALLVWGENLRSEARWSWMWEGASAALCLWFFLPLLGMLVSFLPLDLMPFVLTFLVLLMIWIYPSFAWIVGAARKQIATGLALLGVLLLAFFHFQTQPGKDTPILNNLFYVENADTGQAHWISRTSPDPWVHSILLEPEKSNLNDFVIDGGRERQVWVDKATYHGYPYPQLKVLKDEKKGEHREVQLQLRSGLGANDYLMLEVVDAEVENVLVNGAAPDYRYAKQGNWNWRLRYYDVPDEGIIVNLRINTAAPVVMRLMDGVYQVPEEGMYAPRPIDMIGSYEYDGMSLVMKSYELP